MCPPRALGLLKPPWQYSYLTKSLSLFLSFESGRKQKTPKKFTGEQPSISGTFGLKGNTGTTLVSCRVVASPGALPVVEIHGSHLEPGDITLEELVPLTIRALERE